MNNAISHDGTVVEITPGLLRVRISQQSACSMCKVAGACHASERKEKVVDVYTREASRYELGAPVRVTTDGAVGRKAVVLGYAVPVVLLMAGVVVVKSLTGNDAWAALAGLGCLVPYFAALYALRGRLRSVLRFSVEPIDSPSDA